MSHQESQDTSRRGSRAEARHRLHLRDVSSETDSAPYSGIGAELRAARVRIGIDLPAAAVELRISFAYLQAIEEGRFADLPGRTYAHGFLRTYADYLEIDADAVVDAYKAEASDARSAARLDFPSPLDRGRLPTGRILAASIILAGLVYAGWYLATSQDRRTAQVVTPVPERLARLVVEESLTDERAPTSAGDSLAAAAATVEAAPGGDEEEAAAGTVAVAPPQDVPQDVPQSVPQDLVDALPVLRQDDGRTGLAPAAAHEVVAAEAPGPDVVRPQAAAATTAPAPRAQRNLTARSERPTNAAAGVPARAAPGLTAQDQDAQVAAARRVSQLTDTAARAAPAGRSRGDVEAAALAEEPADGAAQRSAAPLAAAVDVPPAPPPVVRDQGNAVAAVGGAYVPQIYGAGADNPRVVLIARLESWVQVRSAGGELLLTRILRPGDRYLVPDRGDLVMMTGNAGALLIYVDGVAIPAIGPIGAVRRDISLDPERLRPARRGGL